MTRDNRTLTLVGAAVLFIGVFLPIVSLPFVGSMNYVKNGRGDGVIVLILAVIAAGLALAGRTRDVIWPGIASLALLAFTFINFQLRIGRMKSEMTEQMKDNPFGGLVEAMAGSVQLQWGWAVLVLGAALTIVAGLRARRAGAPE